MRVTMSNVVKIGQMIVDILRFYSYYDKFHQDRKISCLHTTNFQFFKMAAVRHVGFS